MTLFKFDKHEKKLEGKFFCRMYHISKEQFRMLRDVIREPSDQRLQRARRFDKVVFEEVMLCVTMNILGGACYL